MGFKSSMALLILNFWPPELRNNEFMLFEAIQFGVLFFKGALGKSCKGYWKTNKGKPRRKAGGKYLCPYLPS